MIGAEIIKIKDDIHTKWFELQRTKRSNPKYAFLMKPIYDEIVALGHKALDAMKAVSPNSSHIASIQYPLHEVERQSWLAEGITHIGPKPYYIMWPAQGSDVITRDINMLANAVHHAGISQIKFNDSYCGCHISTGSTALRAINTGVLKYCQGTLRLDGRRGYVSGDGDRVEHRPGAASSHANVITFVPTEKGHDLHMRYTESGDGEWKLRQEQVIQHVRDIGGQCEQQNIQAECTIPDVSDDEILRLALIISQLKDIDLADRDCIPLAFELIKRQANELKEQPAEEIWDEKWSRLADFREMMECIEKPRKPQTEEEKRTKQEEEARKKQQLVSRLETEVEESVNYVDFAIRHSNKHPCTSKAFEWLFDVLETPAQILRTCDQIMRDTSEPWGWCQDAAKQAQLDIKQAAKSLLDRCEPEGIILGLEAGSRPYIINQVDQVCQLAENQHCLDIIAQVAARALEGIQAVELPFKPGEI